MTPQQQHEYNNLPLDDRRDYDLFASQHPNWDHDMVMKRVGINRQIGLLLGDNPMEVDIDKKPEFQKIVLEGIDRWMSKYAPRIHQQIGPFIHKAIEKLNYYIQQGIKFIASIFETIKALFNT